MATHCKNRMLSKQESMHLMDNPSDRFTNIFDTYKQNTPLLGRQKVLEELVKNNLKKSDELHLGDVLNKQEEIWSFDINAAYVKFLVELLNQENNVTLVLKTKTKTSDPTFSDKFVKHEDNTMYQVNINSYAQEGYSQTVFGDMLKQNMDECLGACCVLAVELNSIFSKIKNQEIKNKLYIAHTSNVDTDDCVFFFFTMSLNLIKPSNDLYEVFSTIVNEMMSNVSHGGKPQKNKKLLLGHWRNVYMVKVADAPKKVAMVNYKGSMVPVSYLRSLEKNRNKS